MCRKLSSCLIALCLLVGALPALAEEKTKVEVASCQRCGDGYCARSCENERTCPADCAPQPAAKVALACGKCGDGSCVKQCGETSESCPIDCGVIRPSAAETTEAVPCEAKPKKAEPKKE